MEEKKIWNNLRSGDPEALEQIYRCYFKELYKYGKGFTKDLSSVEDSIQDMFIDLWNRRERLSETDAIKPYLYVTLKRRLFHLAKKGKKVSEQEISDMHFEGESPVENILINNEISSEKSELLKKSLELLSDRQKEILYLKYYSNMSYEEISEIMDLNYQSARNLVSRAILKLSKHMLLVFFLIIITLK